MPPPAGLDFRFVRRAHKVILDGMLDRRPTMLRLRTLPLLLTLLTFITPCFLPAEEVRNLVVTKFVLARLEPANLSEQQLHAYHALAAKLRVEVAKLRREAAIDKEVIDRRDKSHRQLRDLKLDKDEYWTRLSVDAKFTPNQLDAFQVTEKLVNDFKRDAMALLTDEQRQELKKLGKRNQ
ncbi:MAG: hypothetical protein SynsKO_21460 [Synoicihabitans sp.]